MNIKDIFNQHIELWKDCYFGYVYTPNISHVVDYHGIEIVIAKNNEYEFYPWLSKTEAITLPKNGLNEIGLNEFSACFMSMAKSAIKYGSEKRLGDVELQSIFDAFINEFSSSKYFSNFTENGWLPVTGHSRDSFLCIIDNNKVGMWLSCDDE